MSETAPPDAAARDALLSLARDLVADGYRFTTTTPATHARVNARPDNAWAKRAEDVFGWSRPFRAGVLPSRWFEAMRAAGIVIAHGHGWLSTLRFSTLEDDLFAHSAYPTLAADAVFFGPDTYRFAGALREHLSRHAGAVARAVDIGCGAGPGAVTIARLRPDAEVHAVDINDAALALASFNGELAGADRIATQRSDLLSAVDGRFDLIVANPPYLLDRQARAYRHGGGSLGEGLSIAIARLADARLAPGGTLLLYTGAAIVDGRDGLRDALAAELHGDGGQGRSGRSVGSGVEGAGSERSESSERNESSERGESGANGESGDALRWHYRELDPDVFGEELLEPAYAHVDRIAAVLLTVTRATDAPA